MYRDIREYRSEEKRDERHRWLNRRYNKKSYRERRDRGYAQPIIENIFPLVGHCSPRSIERQMLFQPEYLPISAFLLSMN